jgi:arylamine N-acetyltransferase
VIIQGIQVQVLGFWSARQGLAAATRIAVALRLREHGKKGAPHPLVFFSDETDGDEVNAERNNHQMWHSTYNEHLVFYDS